MFEKRDKRGQLTIFIIIAIVIVAIVFGYLFLSGTLSVTSIPPNIQPAYSSFLTCLEEDTNTGISVLESQGGYILLPDFEPGSTHMPFSSQLNFLGNPIPYWYYVSGNNIQKSQVPTKGDMEKQLGAFIESRVRDCNLRSYYDEGFLISMSNEPKADVNIKDNEVEVNLDLTLTIEKENDTALIKNHKISQSSKLGKLYDSAKTVYEEEQKNLLIEQELRDKGIIDLLINLLENNELKLSTLGIKDSNILGENLNYYLFELMSQNQFNEDVVSFQQLEILINLLSHWKKQKPDI